MQTVVTDDRGVCPSVCLSRGSTRLHCAKTAERMKMLFAVNSFEGPRNIVLDGVLILPRRGKRKHIRCCLCQITVASCFSVSLDVKPCCYLLTLHVLHRRHAVDGVLVVLCLDSFKCYQYYHSLL